MFKWLKKLEFSKTIIVWSMTISTICILLYSIGFFFIKLVPSELVTLIGTILTGTVIAYMAKAGVENVNKIKNNNSNTEEKKTTNNKKSSQKVSGVINTYIPEESDSTIEV